MSFEADAIIRQQIYFEQVKEGEADTFNEWWLALLLLIALRPLNGLTVELVSDLSKRDLTKLIATINKDFKGANKQYRQKMLDALNGVYRANYGVTRLVYQKVFPVKVKVAAKNPKLFNGALSDIIPGPGASALEIISTYTANVAKSVIQSLKTAWADQRPVKTLITEFVGTKANKFKDGLFHKFTTQSSSAFHTIAQWLSVRTKAYIGKLTTDYYEWISVLDSRTTKICKSRDGNVYEWGKGPLPPAHYRCRSDIVPLSAKQAMDGLNSGVYEWLRGQPPVILADLVGMNQNQLKPEEWDKYRNRKRLTAEEYSNKVSNILKR